LRIKEQETRLILHEHDDDDDDDDKNRVENVELFITFLFVPHNLTVCQAVQNFFSFSEPGISLSYLGYPAASLCSQAAGLFYTFTPNIYRGKDPVVQNRIDNPWGPRRFLFNG